MRIVIEGQYDMQEYIANINNNEMSQVIINIKCAQNILIKLISANLIRKSVFVTCVFVTFCNFCTSTDDIPHLLITR